MIGSLMSRMADAEKLSVAQLNQAVKNGTIPAYVGVPLIQEKMKAEQAAKAMVAQTQAQPPIARQVMEQADMMSGLEKLRSNLPEEGFAGGGIVAFAQGGLGLPEDDDDDEEKGLMSRLMAGITSLKSGMPESYEAELAKKGQTPASARKLMIEGPKKGDYVMPPLDSQRPSGEGIMQRRGGHKYEDLVIREAERIGLDPNMAIHVLYKETGNLKNPETVRSKAGAIGVMQLMPKTAKSLGVDPLDPEQNIRGGVAYLKQMYDKYQDPTLAYAAYNAGPGRVDKALRSGQGIASLPRETQNYIRMAGGGIVAFTNGGLNKPFIVNPQGVARVPQYPLAIYQKPEKSRLMGASDANVYPGMSDLNYYNELTAALEKDPTYEPYKEEMEKLLKRNPSLLTAQQPATNLIGPIANIGSRKKEDTPKKEDTAQFTYPPQGGIGPTDVELGRNAPDAAAAAPEPYKEPPPDSGLADIKNLLKQRMEESGKQKRIDAYLSLLQAGLGMMGGTSPFAAANIGQGASQGVAAQLAARKSQVADENAILSGQLGLSRAELYEKMRRDALRQKAEEAANLDRYRQGQLTLGAGRTRALEAKNYLTAQKQFIDQGGQLEIENRYKQRYGKNWRDDANHLRNFNLEVKARINELAGRIGDSDIPLSSER
jgi:hypothetical protein